ncbi:MAG: VCBS repeat-containing protein [Planctomycetaceae bacterium]|nr:VCBS repeat-containing protein [Planctomycetaceae bacterium]
MSCLLKSVTVGFLWTLVTTYVVAEESAWTMHTIDNTSRGADGVRLADVDGDGLLDVATGWEEGGVIRVYRNPGPKQAKGMWPSVEVGQVKSPEDAVLVDVDHDGAMDVISCCEGKARTVYVHWAPHDVSRYWDAQAWRTEAIPVTAGQQMWMFCLPFGNDSSETNEPVNLIVGSKGDGATVSRLTPGADPRNVSQWTLTPLVDAGWIMSLRAIDMDADGDADVLYTDRRQATRGVKWLENTGNAGDDWPVHTIGGTDLEVMFLGTGDLDHHGRDDVLVPVRGSGVRGFCRGADADSWETRAIPMPDNCGTGKAVVVTDVDLDGRSDLIVSTEHSENKHGVFWMSATRGLTGDWDMHPISGDKRGVKFDRMEVLDLDADGDLDVMTCEERDNLGVIWYENPTR